MRGFFLKKIENLTLHTRYIKKNSIKYQITFKMGNIQIIHKKEKKKKSTSNERANCNKQISQ